MRVVCPNCQTINQVPKERLQDGPRCGKCRELLFGGGVLELTAATFQRHLERADLPLLVDFWAPWCGPCRAMAPAFAEAADQLEPALRVAKLNTDEEQAIGARFGIRSIPTMMLFRDGREVARQSGVMMAGDIVRWARLHLDTTH